MAGSYNHTVDHENDGKLLVPRDVCGMLEAMSGDVYEAIEEYFGMVWWLAGQLEASINGPLGDEGPARAADLVEEARQRYKVGIKVYSPGTGARLSHDED